MTSANSWLAALLFALPAAAGTPISDVKAPPDLLGDGAGLHAALERAIGHPVWVVGARLDAKGGELIVQDVADEEIYDQYFVVPGGPIRGPAPQKVGSIDCPRNRVAFAKLDLGVVGGVLADAKARAAGNGYGEPLSAELGADVFCKGFGWRFLTMGIDNDDAMLELVYGFDGRLQSARSFDGERWKKLDAKALAAARAAPAPKAPVAAPQEKPGGGAAFRFYENPLPALAELERFIGEPLRLKSVVIDEDQVSVDLFRKDSGRHYFTYLLAADGGIKLWREDDSIMLDCNKPFAPGEAPFANLGDLVARALVAIGPMQDPYVTSAHVSRNFGCGRTEVVVYTEDERAKGRVVFDDRGRQREAEIQ